MKVSLVVSVFNEEEVLPLFWQAVQEVVRTWEGTEVEMVWVNDGSHDESQTFIRSLLDAPSQDRISHQALEFSRNFGHEAAMIAGIDHASGDAIVCLDSDLQHPPAALPDMVKAFDDGFDIVTMTRASRADKKNTQRASSWFYRLLNTLSDFHFEENASDFFLISARVAEILRTNFRERNRFLRGYVQTLGFDKTSLAYDAGARAAGESKYKWAGLLNLANIAIFSFSRKPLYAAMAMAVTFFLLTLGVGGYSLVVYFFGDKPPAGYTTLIVFLSLSFTMLFFVLAVLSMYIGRGVEEIQERPIYLIKERRSVGGSSSPNAEPQATPNLNDA
jgi:polyisoprenyl-phosphate glycosyltransferase